MTTTEILFAALSRLHPIPEDFRSALEKNMTVLSLPKNYKLLEAPRVADHAFFVAEGFAMSYRYDEGTRQVSDFWQGGDMIIPPNSFFDQTPSTEFIELMIQSEVICLRHDIFMRFCEEFPDAQALFRRIMLLHHERCRERTYDMQHLSAATRLDKLLGIYRGIQQHLPQEYVASWLGITPQSLSRIKRWRESS